MARTQETFESGAHLAVMPLQQGSERVFGTTDWTRVHVDFDSGDLDRIEVWAEVGTFGGQTSGTAWFDDIQLDVLD